MKHNKVFFAIFLLFIQWLSLAIAEDTCPIGMRKTYLDDTKSLAYGSARSFMPALNFYEGNGALWFNRKVLIEPRFEVHLKANLDPVPIIEDSSEQILEGFTIVVSGNKNTVGSGSGDNLGYYGFTKSYIIEFDFSKGPNDIAPSSYSFRFCDTSCTSDDSKSITSGKISNQAFNPSSPMNWDFRLVYIDHVLKVYSGLNTVLFSTEIDLAKKFDATIAYVGFTGYMRGNRRELNLFGTFICEDNFDISQMSGKFYVNDQELDKATYKAGTRLKYLFHFVNKKGQIIPHCFKAGIWTYDFYLNIDCGASNSGITVKDDYTLFLNMDACTSLGEHKIGISETNHGSGPIKTYTIVAGDINSINFSGHDGIVGRFETTQVSTGVKQFNWGPLNGNFLLNNDLTIILDLQIKDKYWNNADIGTTSSEMLSKSQITLSSTSGVTMTMKKNGYSYQLIIKVTKAGDYQIIKNPYMTESYKFKVISNVDPLKSYCYLDGYFSAITPPSFSQGTPVTLICVLKDSAGNTINTNLFLELGDTFNAQCQKIATRALKPIAPTITRNDTFYSASCTLNNVGNYNITGYIQSSSNKTQITSKIVSFTILPSATGTSLNNAYFYNPTTQTWDKIESTSTFDYKADSNGLLTYIDMTDKDEKTLISTCGKYPSSFLANQVVAKLSSNHDPSFDFGTLTTKIVTLNGKEYIGIYTNGNTDKTIKKSSFVYEISLTYNNVVKTIKIHYVFSNKYQLGSYTTCFHYMSLTKSKIIVADFNNIKLNQEYLVGTIELQTTDGYLYNYDIGVKNIIINSKEAETGVIFRVQADTVLGKYSIYAKATKSFDSDFTISINGNEIKNKIFHGSYVSIYGRYIQILNNESFVETTNEDDYNRKIVYNGESDGYLKFNFRILDENHKVLKSTRLADMKVTIASEEKGTCTCLYTVYYDSTTQSFRFVDKINADYGQYTWIITFENTQHRIYLYYFKQGIVVPVSTKSLFQLEKSNIYTNEYAYIDVYLADKFSQNIAKYEGKLKEFYPKIKVVTKLSGSEKNWEFVKLTSSYALYRYKFTKAGIYNCDVLYDGKSIAIYPNYAEKKVTVTDEQVSFAKSKVYLMLSSNILMSSDATYTVDNSKQVPKFKVELYNSNGIQMSYEKIVNYDCYMESKSGEKYKLIGTNNGDYLILSFEKDTQNQFNLLKSGIYYVIITINGSTKKFVLNITGDKTSTDASSLKDFDISKTYFSTLELTGIAGQSLIVNGEFKCTDGLRWNYEVDVSKFVYTNTQNLNGAQLNINFSKGTKRGQFIMTIVQQIATTDKKNVVTIKYNDKTLQQTLSLTIKNADINNLIYVNGCEYGTVSEPPTLRFEPRDKFGNVVTELISSKLVTPEKLKSLTVAKSTDGVTLTPNISVEEGKYVLVQYKSKTSTNIVITSNYNTSYECRVRIGSGNIDLETTYAEVKANEKEQGYYNINIFPKDVYGNDIDGLSDLHKNDFTVYYEITGQTKQTKIESSKCILIEGYTSSISVNPGNGLVDAYGSLSSPRLLQEVTITNTGPSITNTGSSDPVVYNSIQCKVPITITGTVQFSVDYKDQGVDCKSCLIVIRNNNLDILKMTTTYTLTNTQLSETTATVVDVSKTAKFETTFYDNFNNVITDSYIVQALDLTATLVDTDVKLCVSNSNNHKLITVCPAKNGDDNINKFNYLPNGDYVMKVVVEDDKTYTFNYLLEIKGGYTDGSSKPVDYSNTVISPKELIFIAGDEVQVQVEMRTTENDRKNYWYPSPSDAIKIEFEKNKDTCSYSVLKGNKPGQYIIKFTCTKAINLNTFTTTIEGKKIDQIVQFVVKTGPAHYLEVLNTKDFTIAGQRYTYNNRLTNSDIFSFDFKLLDKYKNYIKTEKWQDAKIEVASETFGSTNTSKYTIVYNEKTESYKFTDKITEVISKHTWDIICTDNQNKYYFSYNKGPGDVNGIKSSYTVDKTAYLIKETSTVEITLKDVNGVNIGETEGRLEKEKSKIKVIATGPATVNYVFEQITSKNTLIFRYTFDKVGKYELSVTYDKQTVGKNTALIVKYEDYVLDNSHCFAEIGKTETEIFTTSTTNINNKDNDVWYKYEFYTAEGVKISNYDKSLDVKCKMTRDSYSYKLDVSKEADHLKFTYRDDYDTKFNELPNGPYDLVVTINNIDTVYKLNLLGEKGSEDASLAVNYDLDKTSFSITKINGIAGETYQVDVELRASDNLRWNHQVQINSIGIVSSKAYPINAKTLVINKKLGAKKGQFSLLITQYKATTGGPDNILTVSYESKNIVKLIYLNIKCAKLAFLRYVSGYRNGTVIDLPTLKYTPEDAYGNLYTDLFDTSITKQSDLDKLTKAKTNNGVELTTNNYVSDKKYLNVQYTTRKTTKATVSSDYFDRDYKYKIGPGPISPDTSYSVLEGKTNNTAGETYRMRIYPKDKYGNDIKELNITDLLKFDVYYEAGEDITSVSKYCKLTYTRIVINDEETEENDIFCQSTVDKSGQIDYHVAYSEKEIQCKNCSLYIDAGEVDLTKTTVFYKNSGVEMKTNEKTKVEISVLPTFEITFRDSYGNEITDVDKVKKIITTTELNGSDVKLCVSDSENKKIATVCKPSNGDDNINKWYYQVNGDDYQLIVHEKTGTQTSTTDIKYPVELVGGATEGSSKPINVSKTNIEPTTLVLTAGIEDKVELELRTSDDKRKNYWFEEPEEHIKVDFEKDSEYCNYTIVQGENVGEYHINLKCIKKIDKNMVTVSIDGKEIEQKVTLKVIPGPPAKSILYDMKGNKINNTNLGTVSVDTKYQMKEVLYDKYDNLITTPNFKVNDLGIVFYPAVTKKPGSKIDSNANIQTNAEVIITLSSTLAGEHKCNGTFFPEPTYTITFTHGKVSAEHSYIDVEKTKVKAGILTYTYITVYDQYGNYINATEFKENNPFIVTFAPEKTNTKTTLNKFSIGKFKNLTALTYDTVYTVAGINHVYGTIGIESVACSSCIVNVFSTDVDFKKNEYDHFDSKVNKYVLIKDHMVENNAVESPIYRVYPKDKYGNSIDYIPSDKLVNYKCKLESQKEDVEYIFKLNNKNLNNQTYAEFVIDDSLNGNIEYNKLVSGFYDLIFTDDEGKVVFNITLAGTDGDSDASNSPTAIQNTVITSNDLDYIAGETGEMFIELRTENNLRKNSWDGAIFTIESCNKDDKTFKYTQEKSGTPGVFYITVTSQKANTYPKFEGCNLTIKVNGETVEKLTPEMKVRPAALERTEILKEYYKDIEKDQLKDGKSDINYMFEVVSYDKFNNLVETDQSIVGIKVEYNAEPIELSSENNGFNEYRKYTSKPKTSGKYIVTSNLNYKTNVNYLKKDAFFNVESGDIDLSKTVMYVITPIIKAGEKPAISIACFDKNDNKIPGDVFLDKFKVSFKDAKEGVHDASGENSKTDTVKDIFTSKTPVTVTGKVTTYVTLLSTNEKLDTSKLIIEVIADDPEPKNSLLSRKVGSVIKTYKNGETISANTESLLVLNITLYDSYGNYISEIPADCSVEKGKLDGNDMETISFTTTNLLTYFKLDYEKDENAIRTYTHLVSGTYQLTYQVVTPEGNADFKYPVIITTNKDDKNHGNGPLDIEKCVLKPKELTMYAGDYKTLSLEIRTKKGLLINDEVDIKKIKVTSSRVEKNFTAEVTKSGNEYGLYTITIYSEKKGKFDLNVEIEDNDKKVGPAKITVLPLIPYRPHTQVITVPEKQITPETKIEITFKLSDKFNNLFQDRRDIIDKKWLYVTVNDDKIITEATKELLPDGETYKVTLDPVYPPNKMRINVIYNDGNNSVICFPEDVVTEILTYPDFMLTKVTSKNAETIYVGDILDMQLYLYDKEGNCLENVDHSADFRIDVTGELKKTPKNVKSYSVRKVKDDSLSCQNKYEIITTKDDIYTVAGKYYIEVHGGNDTIKTYNQTCLALGYDPGHFNLEFVDPKFNPDHVIVGEKFSFIVYGADKYGNLVTDPLSEFMNINFTVPGVKEVTWINDTSEINSGRLQFNVQLFKMGKNQLHLFYKNNEVLTVNMGEDLPIFTVFPGPCRAEDNRHFDLSPLDVVVVNEQTYFTFHCYDIYGNKIEEGGEKFTPKGTLMVGEIQTIFDIDIIDNDNGNYTVKFRPPIPGTYIISLVVADTEKYGKDVSFDVVQNPCGSDQPYMCPNQRRCVDNRIKCIVPPNDCPSETPFKCLVNKIDTCVKSMNECDCPSGFIRCTGYMHYCVPSDREDMCPHFLSSKMICKKSNQNYEMFIDGVCRDKNSQPLSEPVCPIGKVLCSDLSCRDNYYECYVSPYCKSTEVRCADQVCRSNAKYCSSIITCSKEGNVVCPDGKCVENEAFCDPLPVCTEDAPYLCSQLSCAEKQSYCPSQISCGEGKLLCQDSICREKC